MATRKRRIKPGSGTVVSVTVSKSGQTYETVKHTDGTHSRRKKGAKKAAKKSSRKRASKSSARRYFPKVRKAGRRIGPKGWGHGETHHEFAVAGRKGARKAGKKAKRGPVRTKGPGESHIEKVIAGKKGARRAGKHVKRLKRGHVGDFAFHAKKGRARTERAKAKYFARKRPAKRARKSKR